MQVLTINKIGSRSRFLFAFIAALLVISDCDSHARKVETGEAMVHYPDSPCNRTGPVLGMQGNAVRQIRALPHCQAEAIQKVRSVVKLAFELLVLTATRSGEVRGAVWMEIDRVPLCGRALEILEEARRLGRGSPLVFPRVGVKPLGNTGMSELLRAL